MVNYVRTAGQQIVNNVVRRALGGRSGVGNNTSDFKNLNRVGKGSTRGVGHGAGQGNPESYQTLSFPLDVLSDPHMGNHGHYIQFFVNVQDKAKIKFNVKESAAKNTVTATKQFLTPKGITIGQALRDAYSKNIQNEGQENYHNLLDPRNTLINPYQDTANIKKQLDSLSDPEEPFKVKRAEQRGHQHVLICTCQHKFKLVIMQIILIHRLVRLQNKRCKRLTNLWQEVLTIFV